MDYWINHYKDLITLVLMEFKIECEPDQEQIDDIIYDDSSCSESSDDTDCSDLIDDDTLSECSISSEESEWVDTEDEYSQSDSEPEPKRRKQ